MMRVLLRPAAVPLGKALAAADAMLVDMSAAIGAMSRSLSTPLPVLNKMSSLMQRVGKLDAVNILKAKVPHEAWSVYQIPHHPL